MVSPSKYPEGPPPEFSTNKIDLADITWQHDPEAAVNLYFSALFESFTATAAKVRAETLARIGAMEIVSHHPDGDEVGRLFFAKARGVAEFDKVPDEIVWEIDALEQWAKLKNLGEAVGLPAEFVAEYLEARQKLGQAVATELRVVHIVEHGPAAEAA